MIMIIATRPTLFVLSPKAAILGAIVCVFVDSSERSTQISIYPNSVATRYSRFEISAWFCSRAKSQ